MIAVPDALLAADRVPHAAPLQPAPDSVQVTPFAAESPCTVAVNACVPAATTLAIVDDSVTEIGTGGADTVIAAVADFAPSATDVAVIVIVAGEGTVAGAV